MPEVARMLVQIEQGDFGATDRLLPLVYDELRRLAAAKLAHEKPGQTLNAPAPGNEAYLRLARRAARDAWQNQRHFLAAAAEAMRRTLLDRARQKGAIKRGGGAQREPLD